MKNVAKLFFVVGISFSSLLTMDIVVGIRHATKNDLNQVRDLYKIIAESSQFIMRTSEEITDECIKNIFDNSLTKGIILVAELFTKEGKQIIGELHAYKFGLEKMPHVLSNLTVVVHPSYQNRGICRAMFLKLFDEIKRNQKEILRVELGTFAVNSIAFNLYKKLGFKEEGRFKNRIKYLDGTFDDQILMAWEAN